MTAQQIINVERVMEAWIGSMAALVVKKQVKDADIDLEQPSRVGLEKLIELLEERALTRMMDPRSLGEVRRELRKAIDSPTELEDASVRQLNREMRVYLRKKFGDVAVYTFNIQKQKLGIDNVRDPTRYQALAESIHDFLAEMVDEKIAKEVREGMEEIIANQEGNA